MNLTTKGRYAVMAMVDLAMHSNGKPVVLADIAGRQGIAVSYLEQIFMKLRKAGLVKSVRGPGGGYIIASPVEEVKISHLISAVNESIKMTRCESNKKGDKGCMHDEARCITHHLWQGLGAHIESYLESISIADVCKTGEVKIVDVEIKQALDG